MPRPPLPLGTWGKVTVESVPAGFRAVAKYRDYDGVTRKVRRAHSTPAGARNRLLEALRDRTGPTTGRELAAESKFSDAAAVWLAEVQESARLGTVVPNTPVLYEGHLRNHVLPALGELRLREVTTFRVDALLGTLRKRLSASSVKSVRSVVSGVMATAVRHGAVSLNPTREARRIQGGPRRKPRALTAEERGRWLAQLEADERAVRRDLPDLTRWMLATGVRIGEALAVGWDEVDLDDASVSVEWILTRVGGVGLVRVPRTKGATNERRLPLPPSAVAMLRRRHAARRPGVLPVFPDSDGGWRDPSNTSRSLREARGTEGFGWVTSHVFRKTCATILDGAGLSARTVADQLGHSKVSMTQDVYMGRGAADPRIGAVLELALGGPSAGVPEDASGH